MTVAADPVIEPEEAPERPAPPADPGFVPDEPERERDPAPEPEPETTDAPASGDPLLGDTGLTAEGFLFESGPLDLRLAFDRADADASALVQGLVDVSLERDSGAPLSFEAFVGDLYAQPESGPVVTAETFSDFFALVGIETGDAAFADPGAAGPIPALDDPLAPAATPVVDPSADLLLG